MQVNREDELDDESYQIRETYTQYGLAVFQAQVLELSIANTLCAAQLASGEITTQEAMDSIVEDNLHVTMGKLLRRIRPFIRDDPAIEGDLETALLLRNRFAHHYFFDHAVHAVTFEGRDIMLADALSAQSTFAEMSERLNPVLLRYRLSGGTTDEMHAENIREASERLRRQAADDYVTPNCPSCLTMMQVDGTTSFPFWACPQCGEKVLM